MTGEAGKFEIVIHLIKAELKNTRFTSQLEQLGFDTSLSSLDFGSLILNLCGIPYRTDAVFDWYHGLVEKYSSRITDLADGEQLQNLALEFYKELQSANNGK